LPALPLPGAGLSGVIDARIIDRHALIMLTVPSDLHKMQTIKVGVIVDYCETASIRRHKRMN
jgi:hypothetical protein